LDSGFFDSSLVLLESWEDKGIVHGGGSVGAWVEKIDEESHLQEIVEWNELEDDSGELINNVESAKADPVGQPLLVVLGAFGLKGNETHEGWVSDTNDVGDVRLSNSEHDKSNGSSEAVLKSLSWLETGLFLDLIQHFHL
jgi:hypothetical protein